MLERISFEGMGVRISYDFDSQKGLITNVEIEGIDFLGVIEWIAHSMDLQFDILDRYCLDRILTHYELYKSENWRVKTEVDVNLGLAHIDGVFIRPDFARPIESFIHDLRETEHNDKIALVYNLEYSEIPELMKDLTWSVERIKRTDLLCDVDDEEVEDSLLASYKGYNLPKGLCVQVAEGCNTYEIVDGKHRCLASTERRINMIVGRKKEWLI